MVAAEAAPKMKSMPALPPLSLYVHIPWCVRKCPYCDFNSHASPARLPEAEYVDALLADLAHEASQTRGRALNSVFFGGGTPSLFSADAIARVLDAAAAHGLASDAEVTLETNPGTVEHGRFDGYLAAGVNRISFGVQSFDDEALNRIGRIHGADEARDAVKLAQDAGFDDINLDLMYALPSQDRAAAERDVQAAVALSPTHISHYQLTLEPNTLFAAHPPPLPGDDEAWAMQESCEDMLAAAGYAQYEVSAYARPGRRCAHNLNYWRFGDYLGIGAGAHAKRTDDDGTIHRLWKKKLPRAYLAAAGGPAALGGSDRIAQAQLPFEYMLNALRLNDGFDLTEFAARTGLPTEAIAAPLERAIARGWLAREGDHVTPTPLGRRFLNDVIASFLPG